MKFFWKILKWIGLSIGSLLALIVVAGLAFRIFGSKPHQPMGELVDVGGFKLHIHRTGEKNNQPTLVIEGGAGASSEYYHWLSEGLKDRMRVVRYDRAGIGYSDASKTPRDPETIARELHALLEKTGEAPPYILAGHSMGGPYIRVFAQLYPDEVAGMVFLDATHPEQVERGGAPKKSSFKYKAVIKIYQALGILGDLGVLGLYDHLFGPVLSGKGLPHKINQRIPDCLLNGKLVRTYAKEIKHYHTTLKRAGEANQFGAMPIRVFTAIEMDKEAHRAAGIDPEKRLNTTIQMQQEYAHMSTNGKQILIDGNHNTLFTKKKNAAIICQEIIQVLEASQN
ncbi:MAG TPA: hypothetical protein DCS93_33675 [Microscillaceae bacterium]|nr:hypothetical protein [Microscillaceae bacterium]